MSKYDLNMDKVSILDLNDIKEENEAQFEKDSLKFVEVQLKPGHMRIGDEVYSDKPDLLDKCLQEEKNKPKPKVKHDEWLLIELAKIKANYKPKGLK